MFSLPPPRHISTLPFAEVVPPVRDFRNAPLSGHQINPPVHRCREQSPNI